MSDAKQLAIVTLPARAVIRAANKMYYVYEYVIGSGWTPIKDGKGYPHSTSAYAALGRITNRESQPQVSNI